MKSLLRYFLGIMFISIAISACNEDKGNYNYLTEDELEAMLIEIDTTGMGSDRLVFTGSYYKGDTIQMSPKVHYIYPENLKYSWIVYSHPYSAVEVGNTSVYPKPDTISHDLDLFWIVDKEAGNYASHLLVEDTILGLSASMKMQEQYFSITKAGTRKGVYVLSEYDGQTDIDYYSSTLCLIYAGDVFMPHYYSKECGHGMLPGKPGFISWGKDYYYVFTDNNGYRLNFSGLTLMEEFKDMFYSEPNFNPQVMRYINNCEFLVNDGRLHVLYVNKGNDRKFSAPIGGDYQAGTYLSDATRASYYAVSGAINSDQVIFDEQSLGFRPYYPQDVEISEFKTTSADAYIDAKKLPAQPLVMQGGNGGRTYAIVPVNGVPYLYMLNFYNVVDDGDLSADGINSVINLSECQEIMNMKYFCSNYNGSAFFYATDKTVYSFSPTSGQSTSNTIYTCTDNEEITCVSIFYHHASGGFPTPGIILWIGVWDETAKEGKLVEFEIDSYGGTPRQMWGPMFGSTHANPHITTGFGKIKSIATTY